MTPSPEIVERVARAMIESVRQDNDGRGPIFLDDYNPLFGLVNGVVDFAKLAQAALAALGDVPAWQPIESAPKDGAQFLGWSPDLGTHQTHFEQGSLGFEGQVNSFMLMHSNGGHSWHPTRWMPLLAPPGEQK